MESISIPLARFAIRKLEEEGRMYENLCEENFKKVDIAYLNSSLGNEIYPVMYSIEPTNACNLKCIMCPNKFMEEKRIYMKFDLFKKIIDEIGNKAKLIKLNYRGEPLLHPDIVRMVKYVKKNTCSKVSLSTNGTLLNKKLAKDLINAEIDEIIFSIDADSPETYYKLKGSDKFNEVVDNIKNFLKEADESEIKVIMNFIQMHLNNQEIKSFKERWSSYNCEIRISWMNTWANQLPQNKSLSNYFSPNISKRRVPCADLWYRMVIAADGRVPLCLYDFNLQNYLGDVKEESIKNIWNGEKIKKLRELHLQNKFGGIDLCAKCYEYDRRMDFIEYLNGNKSIVGRP